MDKTAERAVIQYLHKKGLASKAIHAGMVATLGKDALRMLKGGWQNLNVAGKDLGMTPVLGGLSLWQLPMSLKSMIWLQVTDELQKDI